MTAALTPSPPETSDRPKGEGAYGGDLAKYIDLNAHRDLRFARTKVREWLMPGKPRSPPESQVDVNGLYTPVSPLSLRAVRRFGRARVRGF